MGSFDTFTWQALTAVLTLLGLAGTVAFWRRRGPASGLRVLALALLPVAAYLTGTLRLIWEVGDAVVSWALRFTFSPAVWLGLGLVALSVTLFVVAGRLRRREPSSARSAEGPALPGKTSRRPAQPVGRRADERPVPADDDMADIEAILKRHGIS